MTALSPDAEVGIAEVGIIGAGTMGAGIAQVAVLAGHRVLLCDSREGAAEKAKVDVEGRLDRLRDKGRLSPDAHRRAVSRMTVAATLEDLAGCGLVIEAITEDLEVKQRLLVELEQVVVDSAILASNTSSISITALASSLRCPARLAGMHFFNPAPVLELVEIVHGLDTDEATMVTLEETARAWGKTPVRAASTPGFIVNRVARPFYGEAFRLLAEHATDAATLDAIYRDCGGFRMGPFELADLIGQDVNAAVTRTVFEAFHQDRRYQPSLLQEELVAAGRLGRKSGRGIFDHREGAEPSVALSASPRPAPTTVYAEGDVGELAPLLGAAREVGIGVEHDTLGRGFITVAGLALAASDGRLASERSIDASRPVALLDLCLDLAAAPRVALALPEQATSLQADALMGFLQAAGKQVSLVRDLPGLVVLRTIAMLANEAADAVHHGVASAADVDTAMRAGVRYPFGPLEWAERIGVGRIARVMRHLRRLYGEDRYRLSLELHHRRLLSGAVDDD